MSRYRYAILGTGRPWRTEGATGFGMAHPHYHGFTATGKVDLVAIADIDPHPAAFFLQKYESEAKHYADYREMLREEKPEIVSVTLWPRLHAEATIAACEAGVKAIHCEKPMAITWGEAKRMKAAAQANGVLLTFNHQRRFLQPFQEVKRELKEGAIGDLILMEAECGDMFDWGTHWLDMMFYFNDETPAEWVIGQIDSRTEQRHFGAYTENQAISHWKWRNDVRGIMTCGYQMKMGAAIRLVGTEGSIELTWEGGVRVKGKGDSEWRNLELQEGIHDDCAIDRACADLVRALDEPGYIPQLPVDNALHHTEVIFATYESSRWRGRIDLPLQVEDSALLAMVDSGVVGPDRRV